MFCAISVNSPPMSGKRLFFNYYCLSLFGSSLSQLEHGLTETVCIPWHQAIRRMQTQPRAARSDLLPLLTS
jgi:hypothetical protein